ncbi:MAG: ABC transporter permease [Clostridiaceae bacterium]
MKFSDFLEMIWTNMWRRRGRTILTMIGVVIGSISIFVIVSLGNGFQDMMTDQLLSLGSANAITVYPYIDYGGMYGGSVDTSDKVSKIDKKALDKLSEIEGVDYAIPSISASATINYKKFTMDNMGISGIEMKYYSKDKDTLFGDYPSDNEESCVIGYKIAQSMIDSENPDDVDEEELDKLIRKKIKLSINKVNDKGEEETKTFNVKVSGILEESYMDDYSVKTPLNVAIDITEFSTGETNLIKKNGYNTVDLIVDDIDNMDKITDELDEEGYTYSSLKDIQNSVNSLLNGIKLFLGALGGISLLVAAFGIANTMNMSIYERKKEIGIMKVVGASIKDVKRIFIGEASAIGFLGGFVGVIIGLLINYIINMALGAKFSMDGQSKVNIASFSLGLTMFVLAFATFVGFISGLYPATKAAKLDVISSIKDE